jgi:poly-beta-1,6-N-acetyl-D-glucosamine synthase
MTGGRALRAPRPRKGAASERLLVISPVRNEAAHIERVARAVAGQTRPPDAWIVIDDGSTDETGAILSSLEREIPFLRVLSAPQSEELRGAADRLALAAEARAFNLALEQVRGEPYDYVGKLDGDVELPLDYFERVLQRFAHDPALGIAGGSLVERFGSRSRRVRIPSYHVHGALKLYRRRCFEDVGGLRECLGWDTIDETYARMSGFATRSFGDVVAVHHRHPATGDGHLRGRARHGECAYVARYGLGWVLLRSLKVATSPPPILSGAAFVYGYLRAAVRRAPRVEDDEFRRFVRRELRQRLLGPLASGAR